MKPSRIAGVALLCVLSGSGWLLAQLCPGELGYPFAGCIHFVLIGVIGLLAWLRTGWPRLAARSAGAIALAGIAVFALPAVVLQVTAGSVSEFFSVALFCSIPVFTVLLLGAWNSTGSGGISSRGLIASVAGLGGALRLFPVELPTSTRGWVFAALLALSCVSIAAACILLHRLLQGARLPAVVAILSFASAAALGSYDTTLGWPVLSLHAVSIQCLRCLVFDLPVVWLTVWLLREVSPQRLCARFLLAPLITAAEGYATMRAGIDLTAAIAMLLIAAGGVMLLLGRESEDVPSLHLR